VSSALTPEPAVRCADASEAAGEELAAAVTAESWLLVEVPGAWPRDVSADGALPPEVDSAVRSWLAETPRARLQFIRRPGRSAASRLAFVVRAGEHEREVRRFEVDGLERLASVDLVRGGDAVDGSLVLVCGHGSRDRCCSLRGTAVFGALCERLRDEEVWISSHLGGHRFAANVVVLPVGLQLGRVTRDEAAYVVARALAGRIELDRYRGRTCYDAAAQAAERAVRSIAGIVGVGDLVLLGHEDGVVRLRAWGGGEWAAVVEEVDGPAVPASCGDEPAPQRSLVARIVESPS
jgi:hypothetical protein